MSRNIFKHVLKRIFNESGYYVINKKELGLNILADIKTIVRPGPTSLLFDIGANIGQTAIELNHCFPKATIYSFEPDPGAFAKLEENIKSHKNIKTFNIGFGLHAEKIRMNISKESGGNSILSMSPNVNRFAKGDWVETIDHREVEILSLNSFCANNKIKALDLVKIDTQGYELRILEGGSEVVTPTFTKAVYIEVLFVELYKEQSYFGEIYKILTERGYRLVGIYNSFRKIEPPHFLLWCDALFTRE